MSDSSRLLPMVQEKVPAAPPVFDRIAIVGLGFIGGSIALAARKAWPTALVIGVDRNAVLERAMIRQAVDVASEDTMIVSDADLVVLAAPTETSVAVVRSLERTMATDAVVTDVAAAKREVLEAARELPPRLPFVCGHPVVVEEAGGIDAARADLFRGRPWLLVDEGRTQPEVTARLVAFAEGLGARPVRVASLADHDRLVSVLATTAPDGHGGDADSASSPIVERGVHDEQGTGER